MSDNQNYAIEKRYAPCKMSKFLQIAFTLVFVLAVAVIPSAATLTFILA